MSLRVALVAVLLGACAPGLDGARQAIATAATLQTQAIRLLEQTDAERQNQIVREAPTSDAAKAALVEYRHKRHGVEEAIAIATAATATAAALLPLVERGLKKSKELDGWLLELLRAGLAIRDALGQLGVKVGL